MKGLVRSNLRRPRDTNPVTQKVSVCSDMQKVKPTISDRMLSRKAVAERWQVSTETVKRRERAGLIKPIRFNQRLLRYRLSDIAALEAAAGDVK